MALKIWSLLLVILAALGVSSKTTNEKGTLIRFGGSFGGSTHTEAGASGGANFGRNKDGSWVANANGNLTGDAAGRVGAGGYIGKGTSDPNDKITGVGFQTGAAGRIGGSSGAGAGVQYKDGLVSSHSSTLTTLDKSGNVSGDGMLGTFTAEEANKVAQYGGTTRTLPGNGGNVADNGPPNGPISNPNGDMYNGGFYPVYNGYRNPYMGGNGVIYNGFIPQYSGGYRYPYGGGNFPYGGGNVPYGGGNVPYGGGNVPYGGGNVPYGGGNVPYGGGNGLPYGRPNVPGAQKGDTKST